MIAEVVIAMAAQLPTQDFRDDDLRASAVEIARAVTEAPRPLFKTRELDAAVMLVTDYAEARFVKGAVGDGGSALCEFQLHEAPRSVLTDLAQCVDEGYKRIQLSIRMCPSAPLAQYIGGCTRKSARWQSNLRLGIARHILAEAQKRREFRSPAHLVRDMVEDALYTAPLRDRRRLRTRLGRNTDHVRVRRSSSSEREYSGITRQREARAASDVELMSKIARAAMQRLWPYEPGWYEIVDDGYLCSSDACTDRNAPPLSKGSLVYMPGGVGEIFCQACQFERRMRSRRLS